MSFNPNDQNPTNTDLISKSDELSSYSISSQLDASEFKVLNGLMTQIDEILLSGNSLQLCKNLVAVKEKRLQARYGYPSIWDLPSPYGNSSAFLPKSIFYIPNSVNSFLFAYHNTATNVDDIGYFTDSTTNYNFTTSVYYEGGAVETNFSSVPNLKPVFTWDPAIYPIPDFSLPRIAYSFGNIYILGADGLFRTTPLSVINPTQAGGYNQFKKIKPPLIVSVTISATSSPAPGDRWQSSGNYVDIVALVVENINATQQLEGIPSEVISYLNVGSENCPSATVVVNNTNLLLTNAGLQIYRTIQYAPGTAAPTLYYKCYESQLTAGTTVNFQTTFTNIKLNLNDTTIETNNEQLYNSTSSTTTTYSGTGVTNSFLPTAVDFLIHQNYGVYANVMVPPYANLTFTALPAIGTDVLTIGATSVGLTYTVNSTTPPANDGQINQTTGSFVGTADNGGSHYNLIIKPIAPSITGSPNDFSVPFYAVASMLVPSGTTNNAYNVVVTPIAGQTFDISKFTATGGIVAVVGTSSFNLLALFNYQSYEATITSGVWTFEGCSAFGTPFANWQCTAAATYYLYFLPGTTVFNLDVYAAVTNSVGWSVLPTYELYPTRTYINFPVGLCQNFATSGTPNYYVLADINWTGVYNLNAADQLNEVATNFTNGYNAARAAEDPYIYYSPSNLGQITILGSESGYNPNSMYAHNSAYTSGNYYYNQIKASVNSGATVQFSIPLTTTPTNIMLQDVPTINGIIISKSGRPEAVPLQNVLSPLLVGSPLKAITRISSIFNSLYVFKKEEGIYQVILPAGPTIASVTSVQLIDDTSWLLIPNSVKSWGNTIIYFSTRSFTVINGATSSVSYVSLQIEKDLLSIYNYLYNNNLIDAVRSFVIPELWLYGCYFPNINSDGTGVVYIYNIIEGKWTTWDTDMDAVDVKTNGQLTFFYPWWNLGTSYTSDVGLSEDPIEFGTRYWTSIRQTPYQQLQTNQFDELVPLTNASISVDPILNQVTITQTGTATPYQNIYKMMVAFKNKDIYYKIGITQPLRMKISNAVLDNSIVLSPYDPTFNLSTAGLSTADSLVGGVNVLMEFNKFYTSYPAGAGLTRFKEIQGLLEEGISLTFFKIYVSPVNEANDSITVVDQYGNTVVDNNGDIVVVGTSNPFFDVDNDNLLEIGEVSSYFRTSVPASSIRGRFIELWVSHASPGEIFTLTTLTYKYTNIKTLRSKIFNPR